jgi:ABC-2 type transport system permease protein
MNTSSDTIPESQTGAQAFAPAFGFMPRPFYWSVRRELWENRSVYLGPIIVAVVFLFGYLINLIIMRGRIHGTWTASPAQDMLAIPYEISGAVIMGTALIIGLYYALDALYGERRDRSILFWKSLPVSDLTTVLSKLTIPFVILPLLSFAITIVIQFIMLLLSSVVLVNSGVNIAELWTHPSFFRVSGTLLYHIVTVHGLWYAPIYGWLLLVSAWAPRAPFVWAVLPPFAICGVEKVTFNTTHFLGMLGERFIGPSSQSQARMPAGHASMDPMAGLIPTHFFTTPGLWIGLAIAAAFLAAAVRLRRYRGPI